MDHSTELLTWLYKMMLRIRLCEESLVEPINSGEVRCPVHLYSGQEAIATGVCTNLKKEDYIFGNHRSHGHYLAKGGDMTAMIAEILGMEKGCSRGRGGSMHLVDPENGIMGIVPIVAGTISLALGAALASKIRRDGRVTVSFFGDGATGEGVIFESMNFASLKKLPILFVCENNMYSTHLPIREIRVKNEIASAAVPLGLETESVDGNDVLKVYETASRAVEHCRAGKGPVFLEFLTYRFRGHVGPDDNIQGTHTDIRPKQEIEEWLAKDPIPRFEKLLLGLPEFGLDVINRIRKEVGDEVNKCNLEARKGSKPGTETLLDYVSR